MAEKLCLGKDVPWVATKKGISMNEFIVEDHIWLNIIYSWISPCTHMTAITDMHSHMVSYIVDNIPLNGSRLVILNMKFYRNPSGMHL